MAPSDRGKGAGDKGCQGPNPVACSASETLTNIDEPGETGIILHGALPPWSSPTWPWSARDGGPAPSHQSFDRVGSWALGPAWLYQTLEQAQPLSSFGRCRGRGWQRTLLNLNWTVCKPIFPCVHLVSRNAFLESPF
jgi:hypothetical protein